jgi:hypothetical protein
MGSLRLSPSEIVSMLEIAAPAAGCGGIVDFQKLKTVADPTTFLKELGIGQ